MKETSRLTKDYSGSFLRENCAQDYD